MGMKNKARSNGEGAGKIFRVACWVTVAGLLWVGVGMATATGSEPKMLSVVFKEGQTLRQIAEKYLGDPNLWPEILRVNKLTAINQVQPGVKLKIPANEISLANSALESALLSIQKATEAGARVFTPELLDGAIKKHDQALQHRKQSKWQECLHAAQAAGAEAEKALNKALFLRKTAAQAVLHDRTGIVESRKAAALAWDTIDKGAFMVEKEKVRTRSESTGEILFVDESKLRMGSNSQVVIQALQVDHLNNRKKSSVSLMGGDVYALLGSAGGGDRKSFDLKVPGVSLDANSVNFWVNHQEAKTLIANYDTQHLRVTASDVTVTLKKNQGTVVAKQQAPSAPQDLLRPPALKDPKHEDVRFGGNVRLTWSAVSGATAYRLEVARDIAFDQMFLVKPRLPAPGFDLQGLDDGSYYWRVATIDSIGFPGEFSRIQRFWVSRDVTAPHLIIETPEQDQIFRDRRMQVSGQAEPSGILKINDQTVPIAADGRFTYEVALSSGQNRIIFSIQDNAGNLTRRTRSVICMPDAQAAVHYDTDLKSVGPKRFVTRSNTFVLAGETAPNALIDVIGSHGPLTAGALTDKAGRFHLKLPVSQPEEELQLRIRVPSGHITEDVITLIHDTEPPGLKLDEPPPSITKNAKLHLTGTLSGCTSLFFNRQPVKIDDNRFGIDVDLKEGPNRLVLVASDIVDNERQWEKTVWLDREAPQLLDAKVTIPASAAPGEIVVTVRARDTTGMKRYAWATLKLGGTHKTVRLLLTDKQAGIYLKALTISPQARAKPAIINVRLEDYVGNTRVYTLD